MNVPTPISRPWPCSPASRAWPITWTAPAEPHSATTTSSRGSSTCSPRCGGRDPVPALPGRLLKETLVTSGTMTNRVDRLAERGLVVRGPDPEDRRGVLVRLTEKGRKTVDGALDELLVRETELLQNLDPVQRSQLADLLRQLARPFEH